MEAIQKLTGKDLVAHQAACAEAEARLTRRSEDELAQSQTALAEHMKREPMVWLEPLFERLYARLVRDYPLPGNAWHGQEVTRQISEILKGQHALLWDGNPSTEHGRSRPDFLLAPAISQQKARSLVRFDPTQLHLLTQWQLIELLILYVTRQVFRQVVAQTNHLTAAELAYLVTHNTRARAPLETIETKLARYNAECWYNDHRLDLPRNGLPVHSTPAHPLRLGPNPIVCDIALFRPTGEPIDLVGHLGRGYTPEMAELLTGLRGLNRTSLVEALYAPSPPS